MTSEELMWVVGLLEGEGSFLVGGKRYQRGQPKVQMGSVDKDVIDRLHKLTGEVGGVYEVGKLTKGGKRFFLWAISRQDDVIALMKQLRPHMSARRQGQIDTCVEHYETRYIGKNNPAVCLPGMRYCYEEGRYLSVSHFYKGANRCKPCQKQYALNRKRQIAEGTWNPQKPKGGDQRSKSN